MANPKNTSASIDQAVQTSEAHIASLEDTLGLLVALEQDRRAALLRQEIATAMDRHNALVRCAEAGCACADTCKCGDSCPCTHNDNQSA